MINLTKKPYVSLAKKPITTKKAVTLIDVHNALKKQLNK